MILLLLLYRIVKKTGKIFENSSQTSSHPPQVVVARSRAPAGVFDSLVQRSFTVDSILERSSFRFLIVITMACLTDPNVRYPDLGLFSNDGCRRFRCCTKLIKQRYQREKLNQMKESHIMEEYLSLTMTGRSSKSGREAPVHLIICQDEEYCLSTNCFSRSNSISTSSS